VGDLLIEIGLLLATCNYH